MAQMTSMSVAGATPEFGPSDFLRKAREFAGLSQGELEQRTGISRRTISRNESGEVTLRRPQMIAWAMATGVSLEWLQTGKGPGEDGGPGGGVSVAPPTGLEPATDGFGGSVVPLRTVSTERAGRRAA